MTGISYSDIKAGGRRTCQVPCVTTACSVTPSCVLAALQAFQRWLFTSQSQECILHHQCDTTLADLRVSDMCVCASVCLCLLNSLEQGAVGIDVGKVQAKACFTAWSGDLQHPCGRVQVLSDGVHPPDPLKVSHQISGLPPQCTWTTKVCIILLLSV